MLLSKNTHPKFVQELLLGHATVAIPLDTYSHVVPTSMGDRTARAMDDALGEEYAPEEKDTEGG
jgi:integrase